MILAAIGLSNSVRDAAPVDAGGSATGAGTKDVAGEDSSNAFAATLAAMMTVIRTPAPKPKLDGADSELDTRVAGMVAGAGLAKPAFAAAAEVRATASDAPVTEVNSDTDALNPEFKARLGRVVSRMREEFGHDVEIVEGFRPQSRQEFLYAQGRTRPGDVVTWTKSSKHTLGLAVDVKIDGSYNNPAAYHQLAQIAAQEGLRTLGARDPGHIELPNRGGAAAWGSVADTVRVSDGVSRAVGLAMARGSDAANRPASDSDVHTLNNFLSRVASPAGVAAPPIAAHLSDSGFGNAGGGFNHHERGSQAQDSTRLHVADPASVATVAQVANVADVAHVAQVVQAAPQPGATATAHADPTRAIVATDSAERVGRMLDVRDATPAQPLSHVTLDVDNSTGGTDRITVQLRGGAVDTAIALNDTNRADKMSLRVGELQHALERHGLEAGSISVASTATDSGAGWTPRHGSDQGAQQGRPSPNYRDHRQDADQARQRSRRESHGGKQK